MNKYIKRTAFIGLIGGVLLNSGCAIKKTSNLYETNKEGERLYSLTPEEIDPYDELTEEEIEAVYKEGSLKYPISASIETYDSVRTKSADTLDELLQIADGKVPVDNVYNNDSYVSNNDNSYVPVYENKETEEDITSDELNEADRRVLSYISDAKEKMQEYLQKDEITLLKSKAKSLVVTGIDFLFYDGTIKGFTRKELTSKGKEEVMNSISETLYFIDTYYPGFSSTFGEKYTKAKEYVSEKFVGLLDKVKDWIGEDNYSSLGEEFSSLGEDIQGLGEVLGSIFDDKYQGWKMN